MSYNKAWEVAYSRDRARGRKRYVPAAETRARLQDLVDRLGMTPGPSQTCRDRARSHGYAPPLAWDEDTIDDHRAAPQTGLAAPGTIDHVVVDRVVASSRSGRACGTCLRLTQDERLEAIRTLAASGSSDGEIALAVGVSDRTILRLRQHHAIAPGVSPARPSEDLEGSNRLRRAVQGQQAGFTPSGPYSARPARAIGA